MQFLNTLFILATASFIAAAPAPSPSQDAFRNLPSTDDVFRNLPSTDAAFKNLPSPDDIFRNLPSPEAWKKLPPGSSWQLTGFANPSCQGAVVWVEQGSSPGIPDRDCKATAALAASYRWLVSEPTRILTWPAQSVCVPWGADIEPLEQLVAVGGDGQGGVGGEGCVTAGVFAIGIAQREAL